jgi:hypothetical protein
MGIVVPLYVCLYELGKVCTFAVMAAIYEFVYRRVLQVVLEAAFQSRVACFT